jgi:hypothetical protein
MSQSRIPPPASVLFAPLQLSTYARWRKLRSAEADVFGITPVPTAYEYADYRQWRAGERVKKSPQQKPPAPKRAETNEDLEQEEIAFMVAEKCKHPLHPSCPASSPDEEGQVKESMPWCPTCTLEHHATLITALYANWTELGGPWRNANLANEEERKNYADTNRAYQKARVAFVNTMVSFESMADDEESWNLAHPDRDMTIVMQHSATSALSQYRKNITFPATIASSPHGALAPTTPSTGRMNKVQKKFQYFPDAPETTKNRPQSLWARNLASYDPKSPHACPDPEGYEDTSYYSDWHFSISQCRILLCYYPTPTSLSLRYRHLNNSSDSSFGMENPAVHRLIELLDAHVAKETPSQQGIWHQYLRTTSDVFLVFSEDMEDNADDVFTKFKCAPTLVGSYVETYARIVGDIDDEEWVAAKGSKTEAVEEEGEYEVEGEDDEGEEMDEEEDFYDQESLASEEEVNIEMADPMYLEKKDEG